MRANEDLPPPPRTATEPVVPRRQPPRDEARTRTSGWRDLPLLWKLLGGFGLVLLLMVTAGGWAGWQLYQQDAAHRALLRGEATADALAHEMRAAMLLQVQALKNTWLRGDDPRDFETYTREFDSRAEDLRQLRTRMAGLEARLTGEERALLAKFDAGW